MTIRYSTLAAAQNELKAVVSGQNAITAAQQNQLYSYLLVASKRFDRLCGFEFVPRIETRDFLVVSERINSTLKTFWFGDPLLSLTGVSVGGTAYTVPTQVKAWPDNPIEPVRHLRLMTTSAWSSWYGYCTSDGSPVVASITGIWGYRTRYSAEAWLKYDDVLDAAGINATVTTITVADADGADPFGLTPRFSPGQFIRIGTEYIEVTAVNTQANTLTVRRGMNGSTAAAHLINDDIDSWQTEIEVSRVIQRQAAMMLARQGAFQTTEVIADAGTINYPADLLSELRATADLYSYT